MLPFLNTIVLGHVEEGRGKSQILTVPCDTPSVLLSGAEVLSKVRGVPCETPSEVEVFPNLNH